MKILFTAIGTRGDMEPFLALAEIFKNKGHEVTCLFPEQFRHLAEASGFGFASLGTGFIELINSPDGRIAMGGGKFGFRKLKAYLNLITRSQAANREMTVLQEAFVEAYNPDRIVHHAKTIYPVLWSMEHPGKTVTISPVPYMHYVKGHPHIAFHKDYGAFINKFTFRLTKFGLVKTIRHAQKWLKNENSRASSKAIRKALTNNKVIYSISPSLFPRPDYWPENLKVMGFQERNKILDWQPSSELQSFLKNHPKFMLVTFGSMINDRPEQNSSTILDTLLKLGIPAIINTSEGGLVKPAGFTHPQFHFVNSIPYDWIFPKTYAVIHHGGSGTTHMALKFGCANLIIPHIVDQYVWNITIHEKGAGPLGEDIGRITHKSLLPKIQDLWQNLTYKTVAKSIGKQIRSEDYSETIYQEIIDQQSASDNS